MTARPQRQKKADRLLHPDARKDEIACDYATGPFDRLAIEMDRKWGIDRLPELVSPEIAEKYGNTLASLNQAIQDKDPQATVKWSEACMRGMAFMDQEALKAGRRPMPSEMIEACADGAIYGVLRDPEQWHDLAEARPELNLVSPRKVALALAFYEANFINTTMEHFPDAKVVPMRPLQKCEDLNDEIPGF